MTHLNPPRLKQAAYVSNHWHVNVPQEHRADDLLNPVYWGHVAASLKAQDEITAWAEDGTWYARFLVLSASRTEAKVFRIEMHELEAPAADSIAVEGYEAAWKGPHHKWTVIRTTDATVLRKELPSKTAAVAWIQDHLKSMAA